MITILFGREEEVMKKFTIAIIALSVLAALAGCAKQETPVTPVTPEPGNDGKITLTLTAGQENVETRTAIDANDSKVVNWSEYDGITVFDGGNYDCNFHLIAGAGTSTGTFEGDVLVTSADGYTALYPSQVAPYLNSPTYANGKIEGLVLKRAQTATAGGFDPKAALMYAQSTSADGVLVFRTVVGYVKFTTEFECSQVAIVSNNSSDALAGTIDITPGTVPSVSVTSGTSSFEVSLAASSGNIAAGTYYIALLPGTLAQGFRLVFTMPDGSRKYRATANSLEIKSNGVKKLGTIKETDLKDVVYEDISASGTANCYLVKEEGDYKFKAVQGNSETSVGTVASVAVLWESFGTSEKPSVGDLIDSASYSDGYIRFSTPATFRKGNTVIAAKDADGTILWSWHIWCSAEGWNEQTYYNNAVMMDRNLGAASASIPASADDVGSAGLLYQWGRKDPFIGVSSFTASSDGYLTRAASTGTLSNSSTTITAALAIQNPMTLYSGALPDDSWASTKTIYDPCPAGWRVPDGGENGVWAKASSNKDSTQGTYGRNFGKVLGADETIWYPAAGYVRKSNGELFSASGNYWSATPGASSGAYAFVFFPTGTAYYCLYTAQNTNRDTARSVRCCKE
jgi:uncharacterized protein (TIGR02145 family)